MCECEYECLAWSIEEIAEDYFKWRKTVQLEQPHMQTFEAYLATKLEEQS